MFPLWKLNNAFEKREKTLIFFVTIENQKQETSLTFNKGFFVYFLSSQKLKQRFLTGITPVRAQEHSMHLKFHKTLKLIKSFLPIVGMLWARVHLVVSYDSLLANVACARKVVPARLLHTYHLQPTKAQNLKKSSFFRFLLKRVYDRIMTQTPHRGFDIETSVSFWNAPHIFSNSLLKGISYGFRVRSAFHPNVKFKIRRLRFQRQDTAFKKPINGIKRF